MTREEEMGQRADRLAREGDRALVRLEAIQRDIRYIEGRETLRDRFAMAALVLVRDEGDEFEFDRAAMLAYAFADAMLAAREKEGTK